MSQQGVKQLPILYSYWRSSCSWRVRAALTLKEIPYRTHPIDIMKNGRTQDGEQHSEEFRRINPMQKVPALRIDGVTLIESLSILSYLEEARPQKPLLPADPVQRAKVREICEMIASGIQPLQNVGILPFIEKGRRGEWTQRWISRGFEAVEKILEGSSGKYSVGDEITLADCCLVPQVYNARKFKVDLGHCPLTLKIAKELENHPAFVASHPHNQEDCPPEFAQKQL